MTKRKKNAMTLILAIALAGGIGTLARFGLGGWVQERAGPGFPWGTLIVNITGSILLGFIFRYAEGSTTRPELRTILAVGFCGGYTTFSTFSYETARLLEGGQWKRASVYITASVFISLMGTFGGFRLASALLRKG